MNGLELFLPQLPSQRKLMNNEKQDLTPNNVSYFSQTVAVTQLVQNPKLQISKHNFRHFILDKNF